MNMHYRTTFNNCPTCGSLFVPYATRRRKVVSSEYGNFTAIIHVMGCYDRKHGTFRPDSIDMIVPPRCTYATDIMVDSAMKRFIHGQSCSEISHDMGNGISERHVRNLSNQALGIFQKIHDESVPKMKKHIGSYILQIDGTTDSEYSMIIVVRDSVSNFVLYVRKYHSESEESIKEILQTVKDRFGIPAGITCDMREGILSASGKVFHNVPVRICLMHFLRDLGKDLMENKHLDLGKLINNAGIKSKLKAMLRNIPLYDQKALEEIESGFSSNRRNAEFISIRGILEKPVSVNGSSGYGFPFSLRHLNFFIACEEAMKKLVELIPALIEKESKDLGMELSGCLSRITDNTTLVENAKKLKDVNSLIFQKIRKGFKVPENGNLSMDKYNPSQDDPIVHENCTIIFGELEAYLNMNMEKHMFTAAMIAIERYRKREAMLFAQDKDGNIPRTNNGMEIFFRKVRRNVRKRCGNRATGNILAQSGEQLSLFQNMGNEKYKEIVFGSTDIPSVFAKYRKPFKKSGMTKKKIIELVDKGTEMIINNTLYDTPYNEETMERAYKARDEHQVHQEVV